MKKFLIATLVSTLILFIWQFLSWGVLDLHGSKMEYHPKQDAVLAAMEANLDEGTYFMPRLARDASPEDQQSFYESRMGKPWAMVKYYNSLENNMGPNMIRGFLLDLVSAFILIWILLQFAEINMRTSILASIGVGIIGYLTISYLGSVWFPQNTWPDLLDAIVPWGIIGAFLGWFLPR